MGTPVLLTINPGSSAYGPATERPFPVGTVLCVVLNGDRLPALAEARAAWSESRWMPLVVIGRREEWDAARVLLSAHGRVPLHVSALPGDALPSPADVIGEVAARAPVTVDEVAGYVVDRCGASCGAAVAAALTEEMPSKRTRALLRGCGDLSPHDWTRVYRLLHYLGDAAHAQLSQEAVAMRSAASSRSLSIGTQQFLGLGWRAALALGSWEARLEAVLRTGGYLAAPASAAALTSREESATLPPGRAAAR